MCEISVGYIFHFSTAKTFSNGKTICDLPYLSKSKYPSFPLQSPPPHSPTASQLYAHRASLSISEPLSQCLSAPSRPLAPERAPAGAAPPPAAGCSCSSSPSCCSAAPSPWLSSCHTEHKQGEVVEISLQMMPDLRH